MAGAIAIANTKVKNIATAGIIPIIVNNSNKQANGTTIIAKAPQPKDTKVFLVKM